MRRASIALRASGFMTPFDQLLLAPEFEIRVLLGPGDLLMMDHCRLSHGRTGFSPA